jgi:hypothetical protein
MSVYFRPQKRPHHPWRAVVVQRGIRYEKWFATQDEAQKAHDYWLSSHHPNIRPQCTIVENGVMCCEPVKSKGMCNKHFLRNKRWGDPTYTVHRGRKPVIKPVEILMAPCGADIRPTAGPRRCKMHLDCPTASYEWCLGAAVERNWAGWVSV